METISVDVAPSFETNFRAKLRSALQPKRMLTFVIAMGFLGYLAFTHQQVEVRKMAMLVLVVLVIMRVGVIALSSFVSERSRKRFTMRLDFSPETIMMTNESGTAEVGWDYVRRADVTKTGVTLELRSLVYVFVDFAKLANARELVGMLKRQRKLG